MPDSQLFQYESRQGDTCVCVCVSVMLKTMRFKWAGRLWALAVTQLRKTTVTVSFPPNKTVV